MNIIAGIISIILIVIILQDSVETIILPRRVSRRFRLTRIFFISTWRLNSFIAKKISSDDRREFFLSFFGPLSLIMLLILWAICLILGFALFQFALGSALIAPEKIPDFGTDLYMSGTTFFTLGLGDVIPRTGLARTVTVIEAGTGFGFLALVIGYLPVIYQAFSRRETGISLLDAHAGSPPNALEMLRRHFRGQVMDELKEHLHEWENWSAELLESHLSYPVLMYYRSQHDRQSWLAALTAVLDVSALLSVGIDGIPEQTAVFTFAIACHAAIDLGQVLSLSPDDMRIRRLAHAEFERLQEALHEIGISLHDEETAEDRLAAMRDQYEPYVIALARYLQMPLSGWVEEPETADDWQTSAWNHRNKSVAS
ncbi:MAG: two pore domain potassium channel family protein [Chloroflexi bacterium]|nr:MAG: two pore domain potassium channel family protein [Chloroflexota bacterium]TME59815.1 MAG: two pore domain potassium channel family protein [Chloroflexota bacterium]